MSLIGHASGGDIASSAALRVTPSSKQSSRPGTTRSALSRTCYGPPVGLSWLRGPLLDAVALTNTKLLSRRNHNEPRLKEFAHVR